MSDRWSISEPENLAPDISDFADRAWEHYHLEQASPPADFQSRPLIFVARDVDGRVIGMATGDVKAGIGHMSELLVDVGWQGQGIGGQLVEAFEERCTRENCHKLVLHTERYGPARPFYEKRGWELEAVHRRDMAGMDYVRLVKFVADDSQARKGASMR